MLKNIDFYHFRENMKTIIGYRTRLFKKCFKKVLHKAGKFFGIKNEDAVVTKSSNETRTC